jgi:hypothetical protein
MLDLTLRVDMIVHAERRIRALRSALTTSTLLEAKHVMANANHSSTAQNDNMDMHTLPGEGAPRSDEGRFVSGFNYSPETEFKPGTHTSPETEIKPGQRLSPATEFRKGQAAHNKLSVGSVTVRTDVNGKPRAWVKVAEPNKWRQRAVVVWEKDHGPLPRGRVVHHKDRDTLNDTPSNLEAKTRAEHILEHRQEAAPTRLQAFREARAKVGREDIPVIRQRAAAGETYEAIARDYRISKLTVGCIVRRESWKDVP